MTLWASALTDMLQVTIPPTYDVHEILEAARELIKYAEEYHDDGSALFLIHEPFYEQMESVMAAVDEAECMLIPPMTFLGGWETHRVVSRSQENIRRLVDRISRMGTIEILSLRTRDHLDLMNDVGVVPAHFVEGLTDKQVYSLVTAYEAGLFEIPAKVKMDEVAEAVGISRSTFGEHIRKAEAELIRNLYPFLRLRCCRENDPFFGCKPPKGS